MSNIYDQHRAAFSNVSAYAVLKDGERFATIAFKYPRDGAGRLYAYVHTFCQPMVRGSASGGGYDKHSAACSSAADKLQVSKAIGTDYSSFCAELAKDDGYGWDKRLRDAGFDVVQAV